MGSYEQATHTKKSQGVVWGRPAAAARPAWLGCTPGPLLRTDLKRLAVDLGVVPQ
jgi:hypothetical protein